MKKSILILFVALVLIFPGSIVFAGGQQEADTSADETTFTWWALSGGRRS